MGAKKTAEPEEKLSVIDQLEMDGYNVSVFKDTMDGGGDNDLNIWGISVSGPEFELTVKHEFFGVMEGMVAAAVAVYDAHKGTY